MTPELTVVIATRDRPGALARCLGAVRRQAGIRDLQLVVVDDGSRHGALVSVVAAEADAELLQEPRRGQAAARNAGVARAEAPFVGFLDDDTEPTAAWAASVLERLRSGDAAVTGPIAADPRRGPLGVASQLLANVLVDSDAALKGTTRSTPSANLACRVELARAIPFDELYNRDDAPLGAEDRDWCARVSAAGLEIAFEPEARVLHHQGLTPREFWRRQYRFGRGARVYRARHEGGRLAPARFYAQLIRDGFRRGPVVGLLVTAAQVVTAAGYVRQGRARGDVPPQGPLSRRTESEAESRAV